MHRYLATQLAAEGAVGANAAVAVRREQPLADRVDLLRPEPASVVMDPDRPIERHASLRQRRGQQPTSTVGIHGQVEPAFDLPLGQSGRQHHLVDRGGVGLPSQHARPHTPTDATRQVVGHAHLLADGLPQPAQRRESLEVGPRLDPLHRLEDLQLLLHPLL